ncbi:MAG: hypothetical protein JJU10_10230 [Idiomarina sp.]|nr:hypothetical protein [Idiomarina sp.]
MRNAFAILLGVILGGGLNMVIVTFGPILIPPPEGVDMTTAEGVAQAMPLLEPRHFLAPFLAHAIGTLVGSLVAYLIATSYKTQLAYGVGAFFLMGGIAASLMVPAPLWFITLDLVIAYIPMAWLAIWLGSKLQNTQGQ